MKKIFALLFLVVSLSFVSYSETSFNVQIVNQTDTLQLGKEYKIKNPVGREFWICFMKNYDEKKERSQELILELYISSDYDTRITISIDGIGFKSTYFIRKDSIHRIRISPFAQLKSNQTIERLAAHITSEKPIYVYGLNRRFMTTDTFLAFPTDVLGTEYRTMCYHVAEGLMPEFAIVATENNTNVLIIPSFDTEKNSKGDSIRIVLNRGDVYQVASKFVRGEACDLTGSYIKADKKIAVFSGHQCAYVPPTVIACNHLVEQMPPISSWGRHFYLGKLFPRNSYTFRVLANEPNTKVFVNGNLVRTLKAGEYFDSTISKEVQITASKPILVAQFSHGFRYGDQIGDPMMILVSPTQQFLKKYRFATPVDGQWEHIVNVIVPTLGINSMKLNSRPIDSSQFKQLGLSRYSIAYIKVPYGTHIIEGDLPFGMYSYGFGYGEDAYDAYGTMGGQSFLEFEPLKDTLAPYADSKTNVGYLDVIVRDDRDFDVGISGISILQNEGFDIKIPRITEGTPQALMTFVPIDKSSTALAYFVATDAAMNESVWTVCYAVDPETNRFSYNLSYGRNTLCKIRPGFSVGAFGTPFLSIHSPNFSSTGNVLSFGNFNGTTSLGGYAGLLLNYRFDPKFGLTFRLSLENFPGSIESSDTIQSRIRTDDGTLITFQEGSKLSLLGLASNFSFNIEYNLLYNVYLTAGFDFCIPLSSSIKYFRKIVRPENYAYSINGKRELLTNINKINSLNPITANFSIGVGFQYPIFRRLSLFSEILYKLPFSSLIDDGDWFLHKIPLLIGIRYRL